MNRSQLSSERRKVARSSQKVLDKQIVKSQGALYFAFVEWINNLNSTGGNIDDSVANLRALQRIRTLVNTWVRSQTRDVAKTILGSTRDVLKLNRKYFEQVTDVSKPIIKRVEKKVYLGLGHDIEKGQLVKDGFLDGSLKNVGIGQKLVSRATTAIQSGQKITAFKGGVDTFLRGGEKSGKIEKELMPQVGNLYSGIDRGTGKGYANELGLGFAIWNNSPKDSTTDFCFERAGNLYSVEEIDKWNLLPDWPGRIDGADVKDTGHGYGCRTSIDFISKELAEVLIKGGKELNNYNSGPRLG